MLNEQHQALDVCSHEACGRRVCVFVHNTFLHFEVVAAEGNDASLPADANHAVRLRAAHGTAEPSIVGESFLLLVDVIAHDVLSLNTCRQLLRPPKPLRNICKRLAEDACQACCGSAPQQRRAALLFVEGLGLYPEAFHYTKRILRTAIEHHASGIV